MKANRAILTAWIPLALAGGCATTTAPPTVPAEPPAAPLAGPAEARPETPGAGQGLSEAVLLDILTAEFAGQRGLYDLAADTYLKLARQLRTAQVAERATRVAVFAKRHDAAREAAQLWVAADDSSLDARQALAALQIRDGEVDTAVANLEFVLASEQGDTGQKLRMIANFLGREAERDVAVDIMERLIEGRRDNADALFAYALLALRAEQADKARAAMEQVLQIAPVNTSIAMAYLSVLQKQGDTEPALLWLEEVLQRQPDQHDLRMVYARLLADAKRFDDARAQFEILAAAAPGDDDVQYALGLLYLQESRLDDAKASFRQLIERDQRVNEASYYLGQIAHIQNEYEEALRWFRAVDGGDNRFHAELNVAVVLAKLGRGDEASGQLADIEADNPEQNLRLVRARGEILVELGRYQEAMEVYDAALDGGFNSELLYSRAMVAEKLDRLDIVERDLGAILDREPDNAQALNALGYTLADRTGRYQEAYELIRRALELSPEDFYILDSMGWVLYRLGRLDESITYLRRARAIRDDAEVAAHLAEVLWVKGDKDAARDVWESALKTMPNHPMLLDVIERLSP